MSQIQNETSSANLQWLEAHAGTTNELLSDSDRNLVRSLLLAALQDLEDLERQIAEADSMDSLLLKRVDDTSTRISRLRIAIAPHQTLPTEVLAEVFVNCIEDHSIRIPLPASQQIHWCLGHICSRWRDVALSEPRLWNTIFFRHNPQKYTSIPPALREALNRSAEGPLRLRIYCPPDAIGDPDFISDLIACYAHRCTDIQFSFPESKMKTFLANACMTFEALETASLVISREQDHDIAHPFLQGARVFESAPRLRKLMLHGVWSQNNVALTLEDVNFPWTQLTHIELFTGSVIPSTAHALFIMCPNLQDCCLVSNIHGDGEMMIRTTSPSDITLPHLRHMHLGSPNPSFIFEIIRPLILPALTGVTQHFEIDISTVKQPFAPLISLIRRSRCRLTRVDIFQKAMSRDLSDPPHDMEALLELLPDVTAFWELGFVIPVSCLQRILAGELLNSVRLFRCSLNSIAAYALFVDIVEARWTNERNGGAILEQAVSYNYGSEALHDDILKERARLREIQERLNMKQRIVDV